MKRVLRIPVLGALYLVAAGAAAVTWPLIYALTWLADDPVSLGDYMGPWIGALKGLAE